MRIIVFLTSFLTFVFMLYRWRYRIMNTVLAISFLRKLAVSLSMKIPGIRAKVIPGLSSNQTDTSSN